MSPVGSISNNSVSNFNQIDNTPKSNPSTPQQKVSSTNTSKTENASPEQLGKGLQDVKSGTKSANETVKTGNEIIKSAVISVKGNTEQISKKLEVFLPEEKTFRSLKDDISKLDFGAKTIKQGLDTIKSGVQSFEQTINNGKNIFEKLVIGVGIPASKLNQAESKADVSIRITNFGLRSAELGAGQVQQGIQTIELGTKFLGSNQEKGKELIKNGVDTVNRGVDRLAREASQSAKNIDDAATSVVSAANEAAKSIGHELSEEPALESQHPTNSQIYSDSVDHPIINNHQSQDFSNGCPPISQEKADHPILIKDPSNQVSPTNSTDKTNVSDPIIKDQSNPATNPDNTAIKDPSNSDSVTTSGTTKPNTPPPPINRENLSTTDKFIIDTLGLDNIKPGEKLSFAAGGLAKIGGFGSLGLGANAKVSVERDKTDPNKFNFVVELEPKGKAGADVKALGEGGEGKLSGSAKATITLQSDFSKKGEATNFAFFAAQTGLSALIPPIAPSLLLLESIPGVNLPGEPVDYVRSHIKSLELSTGVSADVTAQAVALVGADASVGAKLAYGGKVDFNDSGTYTVTGNIGVSGKAEGNVLAGVPGVAISVPGISGEATLSLERVLEIGKDGKTISDDKKIKLSTRGQIASRGVEYEFSTTLKELESQVPAEVGNRLKEAVSKGDSAKVAEILQKEILPNFNVNFDIKSRSFTSDKEARNVDLSLLGTGGEFSTETEKEVTLETSESKGTLGRDGVIVDTPVEKDGVKTTQRREIKFDDLKKEVTNLVSNTIGNSQDTANKTVKPRKTLNILNRGLLGNLLG